MKISLQTAQKIAADYFRVNPDESSSKMIVLKGKVFPDGWTFTVQTRKFAESGDDQDMIIGGPILLVDYEGQKFRIPSHAGYILDQCNTIAGCVKVYEEEFPV